MNIVELVFNDHPWDKGKMAIYLKSADQDFNSGPQRFS